MTEPINWVCHGLFCNIPNPTIIHINIGIRSTSSINLLGLPLLPYRIGFGLAHIIDPTTTHTMTKTNPTVIDKLFLTPYRFFTGLTVS